MADHLTFSPRSLLISLGSCPLLCERGEHTIQWLQHSDRLCFKWTNKCFTYRSLVCWRGFSISTNPIGAMNESWENFLFFCSLEGHKSMRETVRCCYDIFEADLAFGDEIDRRTAVSGGVPHLGHTSHMHISIDRIEICINRLNPRVRIKLWVRIRCPQAEQLKGKSSGVEVK